MPRQGKLSDPVWLDLRDVLAIHDRLLALHGGAPGVRDQGLLESALARPRQRFHYDGTATIAELGAAYTFGLVRNHPFVDGNKRIGFVAGTLFLELNGLRFVASEEESASAVLQLAAGESDEVSYALFLKSRSRRAD